ncbi:hypothetical protein C922_05518 [Plasmodium inui San Antonio 1]|uniref:Uncharacterized protein n=1 Tax=Plasmodium inui San Antonio 1 TaxID=1237626 RepID=W7A4S7_9APIC|nr:hypothetical protein C922_05518 [Plasmodium inui San Antonio 1]EUD64099.1 hypothetical protein C922_05518 [Plasmodium inui San Antonio 1]
MNIYVMRTRKEGLNTYLTELRKICNLFHREMIIQQRENSQTIFLKLNTACTIIHSQIRILHRKN